jgi:hypothetical protein
MASSVQVGLEWHGTKYRCVYFVSTCGLTRAAMARLVFPIPPAPRIAMWEDSCIKILTTCWSSASRPWKIWGQGGSSPKDPELFKKFSRIHCVQIWPTYYSLSLPEFLSPKNHELRIMVRICYSLRSNQNQWGQSESPKGQPVVHVVPLHPFSFASFETRLSLQLEPAMDG